MPTDAAERIAGAPTESHTGPVTLINCFDVPFGREEAFLELWQQMNDYFRAQPGYVSHRLHRSVSPNARYRFVNVATWISNAHFQAAHTTDTFYERVQQATWAEFSNSPALYEVVSEASV
jgi:heme-degrading monooxygenase HmoA